VTERSTQIRAVTDPMAALGAGPDVTLFLDRCQVDTPDDLVRRVWDLVEARGRSFTKVVDFGCGDARFAKYGNYARYLGFEIDAQRCGKVRLPKKAKVINACAFSEPVHDADLAIGNPPYVRNQDLPVGWRESAARTINERTGVAVSGLANAWQYFFFLSLVSTKEDGLVALVVPFEWVSRPSASALRTFIEQRGWSVSVYRLHDETFDRVLTTACITIVDKRETTGGWKYFDEGTDRRFTAIPSPTGVDDGLLPYVQAPRTGVAAKRGLSPGNQQIFTLTESERVRLGLKVGRDVIRCVTTLRHINADIDNLDELSFSEHFRKAGRRCWLLRTNKTLSESLRLYIESVPVEKRDTATCRKRKDWWALTIPETADLLISSGFRSSPKVMRNSVGAIAVGGVCGIYGVPQREQRKLVDALRSEAYAGKVVPHANGLQKLEINQINALLSSLRSKK
jgi:hypothetical protein